MSVWIKDVPLVFVGTAVLVTQLVQLDVKPTALHRSRTLLTQLFLHFYVAMHFGAPE